MRVIVTGGAGFIGSILCEYLLVAGHSVIILDTFRHGTASLNHLCARKRLEIHLGDCRETATLKSLLRYADIIIPLAALVGVRECERDKTSARTTNFEAIATLVNLRSKDQFIIYPNTNSGYGTSGEAICTEESPLRPISLYGITKANAEHCIMDSGNAITFRLATVFGMSPRMRWDLMVNDFVYRAVKDKAMVIFQGNFRRNFIHVRDVARAFCWAIENADKVKNNVYNLGLDDANLTKLQLCERIKAHIPHFHYVEHEFAEDPDKRDYYVSNEKIKQAGFSPIYTLDEGITELAKGAEQYT